MNQHLTTACQFATQRKMLRTFPRIYELNRLHTGCYGIYSPTAAKYTIPTKTKYQPILCNNEFARDSEMQVKNIPRFLMSSWTCHRVNGKYLLCDHTLWDLSSFANVRLSQDVLNVDSYTLAITKVNVADTCSGRLFAFRYSCNTCSQTNESLGTKTASAWQRWKFILQLVKIWKKDAVWVFVMPAHSLTLDDFTKAPSLPHASVP